MPRGARRTSRQGSRLFSTNSVGSTLRPRPLEEKALTARAMEASVLPLLASGAIRVPVAATYPLGEARAAYERFQAGGKLGKIVLRMD